MTTSGHKDDGEERDDIAMEGMLRELARGEDAQPDMAYVGRIMKAVRSEPVESEKQQSEKNLWLPIAALFLIAGTAVFFWMRPGPSGTVTCESLYVERDGKMQNLSYEAKIYAGDIIVANTLATISLCDGSEATIDANSRIAIVKPKTDERVRLQLESGRVFLRVTKNKGRFIIDAGGPVEVLGTTFGVARKEKSTQVCVYEGRVAVGQEGNQVEITRGEAAAIDSRGYGSVITTNVNMDLAWARKEATFNQEPLGKFIDWVEANTAYRFQASANLRNNVKAFGGVQSTDDIQKVLAYIVTTNNLKCQINGNDISLRR